MQVYKIFPKGFASNCYLLTADGKTAVAIDPAQPRVLQEAEKRGLKKLYLNLTQMLATRGDKAAQCRLGALYLEGYLGASDPKRAREVLLYYGKGGNADAYLFLGDAYLSGEHLPVSRAGAIECFHAAKALGSAAACVRLGDMYTAEESPNVPYAYLMYKEALALGSREGADKARRLAHRTLDKVYHKVGFVR